MRPSMTLATLLTIGAPSLMAADRPPQTLEAHDGQHDFDWEIGSWKTDLRRLRHPLSNSNEWLHYQGTTVVRPVWNGRANLVELEVDGPAGHLQALSLRLYDPQARQWALYYANAANGAMSLPPSVGSFKDGRAEFIDRESLGDKPILVRLVISKITPRSAHFEQAYSADDGRTWETNWIVDDTRISRGARFRHRPVQ